MSKNVIVIGGGAAGMMAAIQARLAGGNVILLERNSILGKKLLLTGGGRCNLTNSADLNRFINNIPGNGKFLYSCFANFFNQDLIDFFSKLGVKTKEENGGKIYTASGKATDVVNSLQNYLIEIGVKIHYNSRVKKIIVENNVVRGVGLQDQIIYGDAIILATGGLSYPKTGSTGDGYKLAEEVGHTIIPSFPSLVPLEVKDKWIKDLQGLSLRNVSITQKTDSKPVKTVLGELLFTHFGLSGPEILIMSRDIVSQLKLGKKVEIEIDLKPDETPEQTDKNLQKLFLTRTKRALKNSLDSLLPPKMIPVFIGQTSINPDKQVNQISKEERQSINELIHHFNLTISRSRIIEEAIITGGGICTKEINPRTLSSKLVKNLFFAGEVIDVDGLTGGYNLQIAFSTGYLAGCSSLH